MRVIFLFILLYILKIEGTSYMFNLYSSISNGRNDKMKTVEEAPTMAHYVIKEIMRESSNKIILTHDGKFHNDDCLAVATMMIVHSYLPRINRCRMKEYPTSEDYIIIDVGGIYDPDNDIFDHHQVGCNETYNENFDVPLASAGMVWKKYGQYLVKDGDPRKLEYVYDRLFKAVDAQDNGFIINDKPVFQVDYMNPTWDSTSDGDYEFGEAVEIYQTLLLAVIDRAEAEFRSISILNDAIWSDLSEPDILVLPQYIPWMSQIGNDHTFKLCVFPDKFSKEWRISTIPVDVDVKFGPNRIDIPAEWVENPPPLTTFVHKARFLMGVDKKASIEEVIMIAKAIINQ